jgi:VIT1/CCC1 family predicted Fe2+/Mn2+ transporter
VSDGAPAAALEQTQSSGIQSKLNWLRAGVLGANDGIVSTAGIIYGVAGASANHATIMLAGVAAVAAGALSMAAGEYVSVSAQREVERAELEREKVELATQPEQELAELVQLFEQRGVEASVAKVVAREMSAKDALGVHARAELGIDPDNITNPWAAAGSSMVSFIFGGLVPLLAMVLSPRSIEIWVAGVAVLMALMLTGHISAKLGRIPVLPSIVRNVVGGLLAMGVTYGVGALVGTQL